MSEGYERVSQPFEPVYDENSKILILGSLPSVKSRETRFYYGNPQNRFWRVLAAALGESLPITNAEKRAFLLKNGIALYDVIKSCDIIGSGDGSIKNAVPADIEGLIAKSGVIKVLLNGGAASRLYRKYFAHIAVPAVSMPSTSPANARSSLERLIDVWKEELKAKDCSF